MIFSEKISLKKYVDSANEQFEESESRLSQIEESLETRMNGKTTGSIVGAMFGTVCWLAVFCIGFQYIKEYVEGTLSKVCLGIAVALIITLFIDEIIDLSYYGKISSYKNNILQLKNRISIGRSSIKSNQGIFMKARENGWYYPLTAGTSIYEEAALIEETMNSMESLKGGLINGLKNFLYFTVVISITGVGSWALFGTAAQIISGIYGKSMDSDILMTLCIIALLIVEVGEVILAKIMWGKTECSVTNITLLMAPSGPVLFLALIAVAAVIVMLVVMAVSVVIALAAAVLAIGVFFASISGG